MFAQAVGSQNLIEQVAQLEAAKMLDEEGGSVLILLDQVVFAQANSERLMNKPMIMSCIKIFLEKHIAFRTNRLMRVLNVRFFRSIFWVFSLPII